MREGYPHTHTGDDSQAWAVKALTGRRTQQPWKCSLCVPSIPHLCFYCCIPLFGYTAFSSSTANRAGQEMTAHAIAEPTEMELKLGS